MRKTELIKALQEIPGDPVVVDGMDRVVCAVELAETDVTPGVFEDVAALVVE